MDAVSEPHGWVYGVPSAGVPDAPPSTDDPLKQGYAIDVLRRVDRFVSMQYFKMHMRAS